MWVWSKILHWLGVRPPPEKRSFEVDASLVELVRSLAQQEHRSPDELAADLLNSGLAQRDQMYLSAHQWGSLTPREQQVAALACLGYSNRQIAARMVIAQETVKTHMSSVLLKFNLRNRSELRQAMKEWDFGEWDQAF